ncbi:MAG: hypothetical protein IKY10_02230, partial [Clostridia bacterium]|nr:hypothetical protein [Clostridia bacterium]
FPILNNFEYDILNKQYLKEKQFDRNQNIYKLFIGILKCANSCNSINGNFNLQLKLTINNTANVLKKHADNMKSLFGFETPSITQIKTCSIFALIKNLISILKQLQEWHTRETKEYYKNIAHNSSMELFEEIESIISAIDNSSFFLFKHM